MKEDKGGVILIVVIVGPTGVGKTKLSIELAKRYNADVISADSMQIYKEMDVGTAKVTKEEMKGIPHHLIDFKNVSDDYSVYDYQKDARKILNDLISKNKNVIIVGGTGLYLKVLLYDYDFKESLNKKDFTSYTNKELYDMVRKIDSKSKIHVNNRQRLESFLNNHDTEISSNGNKLLYDAIIIGLTRPRSELYEVINNRVDLMFDQGLLEEAKKLYDNYNDTKAFKTAIAYKELALFFEGKITLFEAKELIKKRSRNYAKRQYTWFNNQMNVKWFDVNVSDFNKTIDEIISFIDKKE